MEEAIRQAELGLKQLTLLQETLDNSVIPDKLKAGIGGLVSLSNRGKRDYAIVLDEEELNEPLVVMSNDWPLLAESCKGTRVKLNRCQVQLYLASE